MGTVIDADDYWTRPVTAQGLYRRRDCAAWRVRRWLEWYPELQQAVYLSCGVEATSGPRMPDDRPRKLVPRSDASWTNLVCIKVDVDRLLRQLPRFERTVLGLRYVEQRTTREVGRAMRCSQSTVVRASDRAVSWMAAMLCGAHRKFFRRNRFKTARQSNIASEGE